MRMPRRERSIPFFAVCACCAVTLIGCSRANNRDAIANIAIAGRQPDHNADHAVAASARSGTPEVQATPEYRQAERQYAAREYSAAENTIGKLLAKHELSAADRQFLLRQRAIAHAGPNPADCGPRALAIACDKLGVKQSLSTLRKLAGTTAKGTSLQGIAKAANAVGIKAEGVQVDRQALGEVKGPAVVWLSGGHYAALIKAGPSRCLIRDPNSEKEEAIPTERLCKISGGLIVKLSRT